MTIAYALLGLLEGASRHGYDLKQSYDRRFGGAKPIRFVALPLLSLTTRHDAVRFE